MARADWPIGGGQGEGKPTSAVRGLPTCGGPRFLSCLHFDQALGGLLGREGWPGWPRGPASGAAGGEDGLKGSVSHVFTEIRRWRSWAQTLWGRSLPCIFLPNAHL